MRTFKILLCASLLGSAAGAQIPAPKAKAPAPVPTPKGMIPPRWDFEFTPSPMWDLSLGNHFALDFPHEFDLKHEFDFDVKDKFDFDFTDKDFKFDLKHDWDMNLELPHFELPHEFGWAQGVPVPRTPKSLPPADMSMPRSLLPGEGFGYSVGEGPGGALTGIRPEQGSPEDSLYRRAREALNRGEYNRASTLFQSLEQKYPRSRVAPAAMYYRAFALYRAGGTDELRAAVEALKVQQERYPEAANDPDAATLRTRLYAALAARGDAQAATALRAATAGGPTCDKEDVEVRAEALNALAQINPPEARPTLKKVLARRDECSIRLRRSAVYILGRSGTDESAADLLEVAKTDPDPSVRSDAIVLLGRSSGAATVRTLETIFNEAPDDRTRQAALSALKSKGGPEATRVLRTIIERSDVNERMRAEAVSQLAEWCGQLDRILPGGRPPRPPEAAVRSVAASRTTMRMPPTSGPSTARRPHRRSSRSIISAPGADGGHRQRAIPPRHREEPRRRFRFRRDALSRLRVSSLSIEEIGKLFDALPERDLRSAVVNQLASREEPAAMDKLIEIIKSGTDPQIRREAISALARKNDPRATKFLLDLVEKP